MRSPGAVRGVTRASASIRAALVSVSRPQLGKENPAAHWLHKVFMSLCFVPRAVPGTLARLQKRKGHQRMCLSGASARCSTLKFDSTCQARRSFDGSSDTSADQPMSCGPRPGKAGVPLAFRAGKCTHHTYTLLCMSDGSQTVGLSWV